MSGCLCILTVSQIKTSENFWYVQHCRSYETKPSSKHTWVGVSIMWPEGPASALSLQWTNTLRCIFVLMVVWRHFPLECWCILLKAKLEKTRHRIHSKLRESRTFPQLLLHSSASPECVIEPVDGTTATLRASWGRRSLIQGRMRRRQASVQSGATSFKAQVPVSSSAARGFCHRLQTERSFPLDFIKGKKKIILAEQILWN